jgi:hypothetical protein
MITIDIEARNSPRYAQPQISFRRTDQDRRPSRPCVRPNDGPGIGREAYARELADRLAAKPSPLSQMSERYEDRVRQRREQTTIDLLAFIAKHPEGCSGRKCIAFIQTRPDYVSKILIALEEQGHITRALAGEGGLIDNKVTDQGRAYLTSLT